MKRIVALLILLTLAFTMAACGQTSNISQTPAAPADTPSAAPAANEGTETAAEKNTFKIGFSQCVMNHPFRIAMVDSFKEAAKAYDDVEIVVVEGDGNVQTEITNIESLIQQGCDAIIVSSLSGTAIYPAYKQVQDAGIPLIIAASGNAKEDEDAYNYYDTFVSTDEVEMGIAAADYANYLLNGEGNVVMIRGVVESTNSINRYVGWNQQIVNYPGIKVIAEQSAEWLRLKANEVMTNILQANKEIDLVYAENDEMALGALMAIQDAGRENEIKIISMDGQEDAAMEVKAGGPFKLTITNNSDTKEALAAAYKLAKGEKVDKRIVLPYEKVTSENVDEYLANNF
ncbi:MAG: substrate-binding domain-containing protein [Clostridiaceae bacterium]|nr:substrate-binding domain-containing protein [Clostridiaceae bacterium]